MRRKRSGEINARTAHAMRLLIDRHAGREYRVIGLTGRIVLRAEDLLELHALRTYDSVQLASALESKARLVAAGLPEIAIVSADARLLSVAAAEGLATVDPVTQA